MSSGDRPNILVFFTDQQRWDSCGCYGQTLPVTPNLDRLANEGVRFEFAFTCQPVCGPLRAAVQTGVYPTSVSCHLNHRMLPIDADTVAKRMGAAGYFCGYIGKWHLASFGPHDGQDDVKRSAIPPERRGGWDDFWLASDALELTSCGYGGYMFDKDGKRWDFDKDTYRVDALTQVLMDYLDVAPKEQPMLTFVSYLEPHHQNNHFCFEGPRGSRKTWKDYDVPGDLTGTLGDWRWNYPDYLGCCNALDQALGKVVAKLRERGELENTLLLFSSDHACHFWTRNEEYKRSCHDNSIRIPLVARGPGFMGGKVATGIASNLDLPGTILRAAGLDVPAHFHGATLQDVFSGVLHRSALLVQISESHCGRCLRTTRWTYSVRAPGSGKQSSSTLYFEDFLYDNETDPHQRKNLVNEAKYETIREELRCELLQRLEAAGETAPSIQKASQSINVVESCFGLPRRSLLGNVVGLATGVLGSLARSVCEA